MAIGLYHYLIVSAILFTIGVIGIIVNRKNIIIILMAIEIMLLAVNINLVAFSVFVADAGIQGQVFAMLVLTVAAAEAAVGLAILVVYFRNRGNVDIENVDLMKG